MVKGEWHYWSWGMNHAWATEVHTCTSSTANCVVETHIGMTNVQKVYCSVLGFILYCYWQGHKIIIEVSLSEPYTDKRLGCCLFKKYYYLTIHNSVKLSISNLTRWCYTLTTYNVYLTVTFTSYFSTHMLTSQL